jgi:hypothetical protein
MITTAEKLSANEHELNVTKIQLNHFRLFIFEKAHFE